MPRKPSPLCRICQGQRDPKCDLALCRPCYNAYAAAKADRTRRAAGVPKREKATVCGTPECGKPRDMNCAFALCGDCYRAKEREKRRTRLGIKPENFRFGKRPFPLGTCIECGATPVTHAGRCSEHYRAMNRMYSAKARRKAGCKENTPPQPRRERQPKRAPKPKSVVVRPYVPQVQVVIGPEAFERVKPVDIRGHRVTRIPAVHGWGR